MRNVPKTVISRKGGTNAGHGGHREREDREGFRGIQSRKEASNRDPLPDSISSCPALAVGRLWGIGVGLFL